MRTLQNIQFLVVMTFFLVLMVTVLLPTIELITNTIVPLMPDNQAISGIPAILTAVFVGMPLVLLGGTVLVGFVIAAGLRGTSR